MEGYCDRKDKQLVELCGKGGNCACCNEGTQEAIKDLPCTQMELPFYFEGPECDKHRC